MRQKLLIGIVSAATALSATLILVGCGGGGGPIAPPSNNPQPSVSALFLALLPSGQKDATYIGDAECLKCHNQSGKAVARKRAGVHTRGRADEGPPQIDLAGWKATQHFKIGVTCEQCHGPGSNHKAAPGPNTILAVLSPKTVDGVTKLQTVTNPIVCGQCHADIQSDYSASKHAELVTEGSPDEGPFNNGSKSCLRCHNGVFRADMMDNTVDNFNPATGASTPSYTRIAQVEDGITALSAADMTDFGEAAVNTASCVDCHDPMRATGIKIATSNTGKMADLQLLRPTFSLDTSNYPAGPTKTLTNFAQTCATCHAGGTSTGADGRDSKLQASTSRQSFHENPQYPMLMGAKDSGSENITLNGAPLNQPPAPDQRNTKHATGTSADWDQCVHCHMPNGSHTWTVKLDVSCQPCHTANDAQARLAVQGLIQNDMAALRTRMSNWAVNIAKLPDPDDWEYTQHLIDEGKTAPSQSLIPIEIRRARHNYYFILRDSSWGVHNRKYAQYLLDIANRNLDYLGVARAPIAPMSRAQVMSVLNHDIQVSRRSAARDRGI